MTGSIVRVNPQRCKIFFCNSSPYSVKSHGFCPKHYQRYRRHAGSVLDADTEALLNWIYDNFLPGVEAIIRNHPKTDATRMVESALDKLNEISEFVEGQNEDVKEISEFVGEGEIPVE